MAQAISRSRAIAKMRKVARLKKVTRGLWNTGSLPQRAYGHQIMGMPFCEITRLRRQAARAAVGQGPGRRLTTILATSHGEDDPAKAIRRQQISAWLTLWCQNPQLHPRIIRTWDKVVDRIRPAGQRRWCIVKGPATATIATLLDMNWCPVSATQWDTDAGQSWAIPDASQGAFADYTGDYVDILQDIKKAVDRQLWANASKHEAGDDLHKGAESSARAPGD